MMVDSQTYWLSAAAQAGGTAEYYLLPGFDEYILGYKARGAVLAPAHRQAIVPGGNGVFRPTMIADGQVVGVWKRLVKGQRVMVTLAPFAEVSVAGWRNTAVFGDDAVKSFPSSIRQGNGHLVMGQR